MAIKEFFIILAALFIGYVLSSTFNIPIPSNVLGFMILFAALCFKIVKPKQIEKISDFIIKYLAVFFVVPSVGLMLYLDLLKSQFLHIVVPLMVSILLGYFTAAKVTEVCIRVGEKKMLGKGRASGGGEHE
jgi:putative effector of murein hydrolase LrgA (UPF0299 family)